MQIKNGMASIRRIILSLCFFTSSLVFAAPIEVALTIDDLPVQGIALPSISRIFIVEQMLAALEKHHLQGVYGFMNAEKAQSSHHNLQILQKWIQGGQLLGNHTYSHMNLEENSANKFIDDIKKNEPLLKTLMQDKNYRYFRYPYLQEGNTLEKRNAIRNFLFKNDYKIAQVTIDFSDYEWNKPYIRCLTKQNEKNIAWLKQSYLQQSLNALVVTHQLSQEMFKRDVKNILLIHVTAFDGLMLDDLLTAYEKQGVKFIPLAEALTDEIYQFDPGKAHDDYNFLNQIRTARGFVNPKSIAAFDDKKLSRKLKRMCQ